MVEGGDCAMKYRAGLKRLLSMEWLPAPVGVLAQVLEELEHWGGDSAALERKLQREPSITAQVLKVANSAYYGCQQEVHTLARAIVVIGIKEVRNICLGVALIQQFQGLEPARPFRRNRYWSHSFATARFASRLAKEQGLACADAAFVLALLHDIGRLVLAYYLPEIYTEMAKVPPGVNPYGHEKELCFTHAEVGYWLCRKWRLPPMVAEVVRFHHEPLLSKRFPQETSLVHVAAAAIRMAEMGSLEQQRALENGELPAEEVLERIGLTPGRFMLHMEGATEALEGAEAVLRALLQG